MKFTKFLVFGAGLIGLISFFLPLIGVKSGPFVMTVSPYQMVVGIDSLQDIASDTKTEANEKDVEEFNKAMGEVKAVVLGCYAPALLLTLFGLLGVIRKKFGRGIGAGSLLFGLISLGIWAIINAAAGDVEADTGQSLKGIGMWMMLLTGLGGSIGGLLTLIKPDRGEP